MDEVNLIKKDVEVFVQKCVKLIEYSQNVIDSKGILSRFFDIMERLDLLIWK